MQSFALKFRTVGLDVLRLVARFGIAVGTTASQFGLLLVSHTGHAMSAHCYQLIWNISEERDSYHAFA